MSDVNTLINRSISANDNLLALIRQSGLSAYSYRDLTFGQVTENTDPATGSTRNTLLPITFTIGNRKQSAILRYHRPTPAHQNTLLEITNTDDKRTIDEKLRAKGIVIEEVTLPDEYWVGLSSKPNLSITAKEHSLLYKGTVVISINNATELILLGDLRNIDAEAFARLLVGAKIIAETNEAFTVGTVSPTSEGGKEVTTTITTRRDNVEKTWRVAWSKQQVPSDLSITLSPGYTLENIKEALRTQGVYIEDINVAYANDYMVRGQLTYGAKNESLVYKGSNTIKVESVPTIRVYNINVTSNLVPQDFRSHLNDDNAAYFNKEALIVILKDNNVIQSDIATLSSREDKPWVLNEAFTISGDDVTVKSILSVENTLANVDIHFNRVDIASLPKSNGVNYDYTINAESLITSLYSIGILARDVLVEVDNIYYPLYKDNQINPELTNDKIVEWLLRSNAEFINLKANTDSLFYSNLSVPLSLPLVKNVKPVNLIGFLSYSGNE